ncbi:hypothetical protein OXPF_34540 [Oxobacter pfennigii]|uniref:Uncharacterized protein n=1 Tax=Oxobacter pfennigii TaxID=36849 RepID=A0A0P9AD40_9CLOT|nr:terminase small subunit [Oxobacter pfennigii]KPU43022.1 hypothetical protein OXPF_34540 [Oxobacter pfennigii]
MPAGRPRKYKTAKAIEKAIEYYFDSITKTELAFENILTGYEDEEKTKPIYNKIPLLNNAGEQIKTTIYFENPSILGMCAHMGIDRATLLRYEQEQEYCNTIKKAKEKIEKYLEEKLYRHEQVTGIIFNLKNNFGWKDKTEVEQNISGDINVNIKVVE